MSSPFEVYGFLTSYKQYCIKKFLMLLKIKEIYHAIRKVICIYIYLIYFARKKFTKIFFSSYKLELTLQLILYLIIILVLSVLF